MNAVQISQTVRKEEVSFTLPSRLAHNVRNAEAKIREDLFRFRTCCADPRASK